MNELTAAPKVGIVLTAAINVESGSTAVTKAEIRRAQYLEATRFYSAFAPVFLVEHSHYPILQDDEFTVLPNVFVRSIVPTQVTARGKGYREFHGLDAWYLTEPSPPQRMLKITGRYMVYNVESLLCECTQAKSSEILVDLCRINRRAHTSVFSISWADYGEVILGRYREMDDAAMRWAEHVVYQAVVDKRANFQFFRHEPDLGGISGSTNLAFRASRAKLAIKQCARNVNALIDQRFLYFHGVPSTVFQQRSI